MAHNWPRIMCHRYIIPLFRRRLPGLPKAAYKRNKGKGNKKSNNHPTYRIVRTNKSHNRSKLSMAIFRQIRRTGISTSIGRWSNPCRHHLHRAEIQSKEKSREWRNKVQWDIQTASMSSVPPPPTLYPYYHGRSGLSRGNLSTRSRVFSWCSAGSQLVCMWL